MIETDPELHVEVMDCVTFVARHVLPVLGEYRKLESLTIHPTCSSTQMGLNPDLVTVSQAVAEVVNVPLDWGCCAYAGDRGMLHLELTASATRREAAEAELLDAEAHASCNRTCELGLTRATGKPYRHVVNCWPNKHWDKPRRTIVRPSTGWGTDGQAIQERWR